MKHFFDRTCFFFTGALLLIGVVVYNSIPNNKPARVKAATRQKTQLSDFHKHFDVVNKGDSVVILGQDVKSLLFLATTSDGRRGYIPQEAVDNKGILYDVKHVDQTLSVHRGDTVTLLGRSGDQHAPKMKIQTAAGKQGEVDVRAIITLTGSTLLKYQFEGGDYYLSKEKFEKRYIGKTFEETERLYRTARIVKRTDKGLVAEYDLRVFDKTDGRFYTPKIAFKNGVASSYSLDLTLDRNALFLKYLPFVATLLDVDFLAQLISSDHFEAEELNKRSISLSGSDESIWLKIFAFVVLLLLGTGFLLFVFFLNHTVPFFFFGLLRFEKPLAFLSNQAVRWSVLALTVVGTYIWLVLGLCYPYHWWYFIPILLIAAYWVTPKMLDLFEAFPSSRCPDCKRLYTIGYFTEEQVDEYEKWNEDTKSKLVNSRQGARWQTWDDITTVTKDGTGRIINKHNHRENVQNHSETIKTYQNDVYDVLHLVKVFKITYKCEHCGYEEYGRRHDLTELDRKYKGSYESRRSIIT